MARSLAWTPCSSLVSTVRAAAKAIDGHSDVAHRVAECAPVLGETRVRVEIGAAELRIEGTGIDPRPQCARLRQIQSGAMRGGAVRR